VTPKGEGFATGNLLITKGAFAKINIDAKRVQSMKVSADGGH
jgi:hypothetical protein